MGVSQFDEVEFQDAISANNEVNMTGQYDGMNGVNAAKQLEAELNAAAEAHHIYEKNLGKPDTNWSTWYALYIIEQRRKLGNNWVTGVK